MMRSCWQQDPNKRPTFARISELLDKYLEELAGYLSMGCLFPEIQQQQQQQQQRRQQDPRAAWKTRKRSSSAMPDGSQRQPLTTDKMTISVISPKGTEKFL